MIIQEVLFKQLRRELRNPHRNPNSVKAVNWYYERLKRIASKLYPESFAIEAAKVSKLGKVLNQGKQGIIPQGSMFFFLYDPKYSKSLDYYDICPMVIVIKTSRTGFLGLNIHYLPYKERILFFRNLVLLMTNKNMDKGTRFDVTYDYLKTTARMRYFRPCLKRYLYSQIRTNIVYVHPKEWSMATLLPVHKFRKKDAQAIWEDSRRSLR